MKDIYHDHEITLTGDYKFMVKGPFITGQFFASWDDATAAIGKAEKAAADAKKRNLKLPVRLPDGRLVHIKGINGTTGNCLFVEKVEVDDGPAFARTRSEVFPVSDAISTLLTRRRELTAELKDIDFRIDPFRIKISRRYGRITPDAMIGELDRLEGEHKEKTEAAAKTKI